MTVVVIHQPEYLPWLGLIDKVKRADVFVLLDDVQFNRASLQHRAKVAGPRGLEWLTIPFCHRHPQLINEVEIADDGWWSDHAVKLDRIYDHCAGYGGAYRRLARLFVPEFTHVADIATVSMRLLFEVFNVTTPIVRSSTLKVSGQKSERVLSICQAVGATRYLAGRTSAETYLDHEVFAQAHIGLDVHHFEVPDYPRPWPLPATQCLSAVDAWLCVGEGVGGLLK